MRRAQWSLIHTPFSRNEAKHALSLSDADFANVTRDGFLLANCGISDDPSGRFRMHSFWDIFRCDIILKIRRICGHIDGLPTIADEICDGIAFWYESRTDPESCCADEEGLPQAVLEIILEGGFPEKNWRSGDSHMRHLRERIVDSWKRLLSYLSNLSADRLGETPIDRLSDRRHGKALDSIPYLSITAGKNYGFRYYAGNSAKLRNGFQE